MTESTITPTTMLSEKAVHEVAQVASDLDHEGLIGRQGEARQPGLFKTLE